MILNFRVDKWWPRKASSIQRIAAKIVASMLLENPTATWQMYGKRDGSFTYSEHTQLAQIVLREAGFSVCEADLMKLCGIDPSKKIG